MTTPILPPNATWFSGALLSLKDAADAKPGVPFALIRLAQDHGFNILAANDPKILHTLILNPALYLYVLLERDSTVKSPQYIITLPHSHLQQTVSALHLQQLITLFGGNP